jgi:hypothetical protein
MGGNKVAFDFLNVFQGFERWMGSSIALREQESTA